MREPAGLHLPTLRSNFRSMLVGNCVFAATQWGLLIALAKLGSPRMVGEFSLGLAIAGPVLLLFGLSLKSVQATDAGMEFPPGDYLRLRLACTTAAMLVITAITLLCSFSWESVAVILLVAVAKGLETISDILYARHQLHERLDRVAFSLVLRGVIGLGALAIVLRFTHSLPCSVAALAASWALILIAYDWPSVRRLETTGMPDRPTGMAQRKRLLRMLRRALPLGIAAGLISLIVNIPRYFVRQHLGDSELGIFAGLAYIAIAGSTVIMAMGDSATPRFAKYYTCGDRVRFNALLRKLVAFAMLTGLGGVAVSALVGSPLLRTMYREEFARHAGLLVWLMGAATLSYVASMVGYAVTATRTYRRLVGPYLLITMCTAVACWWLVPRYGLFGAAYVVCASNVVTLGALVLLLKSTRFPVTSGAAHLQV